MAGKRIVLSGILYLVLSLVVRPQAFAVVSPTFPSCSNPQGTVKVSYAQGTHGIVGSGATYSGSDAVYTLTDNSLTQCFCSVEGNGIQTNWMKAGEISQDQIKVFESQGWVFIPTGAAWGLEDVPYLAQNANYSCLPQSGGGSGGGTGVSDGRTESLGCLHTDCSNQQGAQVLGISTGQVLGLATTGNIAFVLSVFILGFASLTTGAVLSAFKRKK
jgi:hypothetical protein